MRTLKALLILALLLAVPLAHSASPTELTWLGHSSFKITTPSGNVIFIDPWITNPGNPDGAAMLAAIDRADLIMITHTHIDHIMNAVDIARRTGARLVASFGVRQAMIHYAGYPAAQARSDGTGDFGGKVTLLNGEMTVGFVPAVHGSFLNSVNATAQDQPPVQTPLYGGEPGGFWISIKNGPTFYHTGDTDLFQEMANVNLFGSVDMMLVPIGDKFTMGPERAALATKLVGPKMVAPMHYGTSPSLTGTPEAFETALSRAAPMVTMVRLRIGYPMPFKTREVYEPPKGE